MLLFYYPKMFGKALIGLNKSLKRESKRRKSSFTKLKGLEIHCNVAKLYQIWIYVNVQSSIIK